MAINNTDNFKTKSFILLNKPLYHLLLIYAIFKSTLLIKVCHKLVYNNIRTNKKYTRINVKHTGSGIILMLVYETFSIG